MFRELKLFFSSGGGSYSLSKSVILISDSGKHNFSIRKFVLIYNLNVQKMSSEKKSDIKSNVEVEKIELRKKNSSFLFLLLTMKNLSKGWVFKKILLIFGKKIWEPLNTHF